MQTNANRSIFVTLKFKSKWSKSLNIKLDTWNLIEEKVENFLERIGTGDKFLNRIPTAQAPKQVINKWDFMTWKIFVRLRILSIGQNGSPQNGKDLLQPYI